MSEQLRLFATAPKGVTQLLFTELEQLGAESVREQPAGVEFSADLATAYRICLWSRTASRILLPLAKFPAVDPDALYEGVQKIDWSEHFDTEATIAIDFVTRSSQIKHSQFGAQKTKDAIVDQFRDATGERPSVDIQSPDIRINVFLQYDEAMVYLDLSGDALHRRGYRLKGGVAPLKENLAAAILLRAGWPELAKQGYGLLDPMCGSGTLLIEGAMMAADIAPGLLRERYGFFAWRKHDAEVWQGLIDDAAARRVEGLKNLPTIVGYDAHPKAIEFAQANAELMGLDEDLRINRRDLSELKRPPWIEKGLLVTNPPYGERLGEKETLGELYQLLGTRLKAEFVGWKTAVFSGNPDLSKQMGIRAQRMHNMYNGALPCKLLRFDIEAAWFMSEGRGPRPLPEDELGPGAEMLANRLRKNIKEFRRWAKRESVTCYRLYDADLPEYAVAIDLYQGDETWVHVQEYEAPKTIDERKARFRLREAITVIPKVLELPLDNLHFKVRKRQKGSDQYQKQASDQQFHEVDEHGCKFLVNFNDYLDTGLFLDHRITRRMLGEMAKDKKFLNLFAYTGTATVHAARGGALTTRTVDMSNTYTHWAQRNMDLNGFTGPEHELIQSDCLEWLAKASFSQTKYDLIFLDPPTFSTSKRMAETFDIQRDHMRLIEACMNILAEDGKLVFSNNFRKFRFDEALQERYTVENWSAKTLPKDFARNPKIHNCWCISHH